MLVVHCKRAKYDVYIGRPSIFGNPFEIGSDGTRAEVIEKHRLYLQERIKYDDEFKEAVKALYGMVLGCYCAPLPCHGDNLVAMAEELNT